MKYNHTNYCVKKSLPSLGSLKDIDKTYCKCKETVMEANEASIGEITMKGMV